jgi:LysM repeat protein
LLRFFFEEKPEAKNKENNYLKLEPASAGAQFTMNNQSPLVPQGSLLEQKNKGRARVKIAVFLVLAIHGVGLMALLMQGCKREADQPLVPTSVETAPPTNTMPAFAETTNASPMAGGPVDTNPVAFVPSNTVPTPPPVETPAPVVTAPPPISAPAGTYTVQKGDNFSTIAKKNHVSVKALMDANPGVEPTRLKIDQKLNLPAGGATPGLAASTDSATPSLGGAEPAVTSQSYVVKSGDSLTKIASHLGVTVKALRAANSLKTDKIVVGQKLKVPAKTPKSAKSVSTSTGASNGGGSAPSFGTPATNQ